MTDHSTELRELRDEILEQIARVDREPDGTVDVLFGNDTGEYRRGGKDALNGVLERLEAILDSTRPLPAKRAAASGPRDSTEPRLPFLSRAVGHIGADNCLDVREDWLARLEEALPGENLAAHDVALSRLQPNELEDLCMGDVDAQASLVDGHRLHITYALMNRLFDGDLQEAVYF